MRYPMLIAAAASALALAGCASDQYGYDYNGYGDYAYGYASPYTAYYDGYYGPIYDGYWGTDGNFYYRTDPDDHVYREGDPDHFRRHRVEGWHEWRGTVGAHPHYTMPYYHRERAERRDYRHEGNRGRRHDDDNDRR